MSETIPQGDAIELEACPLCEGEASIGAVYRTWGNEFGPAVRYAAQCMECGAVVHGSSAAEAAGKWNRRPQVERLRSACDTYKKHDAKNAADLRNCYRTCSEMARQHLDIEAERDTLRAQVFELTAGLGQKEQLDALRADAVGARATLGRISILLAEHGNGAPTLDLIASAILDWGKGQGAE